MTDQVAKDQMILKIKKLLTGKTMEELIQINDDIRELIARRPKFETFSCLIDG